MKFETSQKLVSSATPSRICDVLEEQFRKVSAKVERSGDVLTVKDIQATFGSINRNDTTRCSVRMAQGRYLIVADTTYSPSGWFWIFFLIGLLFSLIGTAVPLGFYLWHKKVVQDAIGDVLRRVEDELDSGAGNSGTTAQAPALRTAAGGDTAAQLASFAVMFRDGLITKDEFEAAKRKLLNLDSPSPDSLLDSDVFSTLDDDQKVFIRRNGKVSGPFTYRQAKQAVTAGKLYASDEYATTPTGPWNSASGLHS